MAPFVINGKFLGQPFSGVQKYALTWTRFLKENFPDAIVVCPKHIHQTELADELRAIRVGYTDGSFWEQTELPLWLLRNNKPLLLNFGNTAPAQYSTKITTIHDLSAFDHPEWFSKKFSTYYRWLMPQLVETSSQILTVSKYSAEEITSRFDISQNNVQVIYNTVPEQPEPIIDKQNYVLVVGSFNERKNYSLLAGLWEKYGEELPPLKIRGDVNTIFAGLPDLLKQIESNPQISIIEPIDEPTMQELYRHARLVLNPSLYEGFGLPNLEAMGAGCPLIASSLPVFREVGETAIQYADPFNPDEWIQKIRLVLKREAQTEDLKNLQKQAKKFNVQTEGAKLLTILRSQFI